MAVWRGKKIYMEIEYLKLEFPILHLFLFIFFLNSFLLPSRFGSSFLPARSSPLFSFPPNLVLYFRSNLLCSSILLLLLLLTRVYFYKLESIRLEIYVAKNIQISKWNLSLWNLSFILNLCWYPFLRHIFYKPDSTKLDFFVGSIHVLYYILFF